MPTRRSLPVLAAWALALLPLGGTEVVAQVKAPEWKHGLEFRVRKAAEENFDKNTPKIGCEVYFDPATNQTLYISETSALGSVPSTTFVPGETKKPTWLHGLKLAVRKADEQDFTKDTKRYGIEVFKDDNTGLLVYVSETGSVAVVKPAGDAAPAVEVKTPTWSHGLILKVRKGGQENFDDKTPRFGVEVFKDENNGNIVYIADNGNIAVVPAGGPAASKEPKAPKWLYGVEFRVRKANEQDFSKDTYNCGGEIFKDENNGNLVYITEIGSIGVLASGKSDGGKPVEPKWIKGFALKVRKAGELDFTKDTKRWGGEYFEERNTGNNAYVMETGMIAVTAGK
jgi:hypothetical protein